MKSAETNVSNKTYPQLGVSKKSITKAGNLIRKKCNDSERLDAIRVIRNFREAHLFPMDEISRYVNGVTKTIGIDFISARRLKRLPTILDKLERATLDGKTENSIDLKRMQDIGGCRLVFESIDDLYEALKNLKRDKGPHRLMKEYDTLFLPKKTGYRGVHLVYSCFENEQSSDSPWFKFKIEVQLRTRLQHSWATAVETMDLLESTRLKTRLEGNSDIRDYFRLVAELMAFEENPDYMNEEQYRKALNEFCLWRAKYTTAVNHTIENFPLLKNTRISEKFDSEDAQLLIWVPKNKSKVYQRYFSGNENKEAILKYGQIEDDPSIANVVMVAVSDLKVIQEAYPNYYADTHFFQEWVMNLWKRAERKISEPNRYRNLSVLSSNSKIAVLTASPINSEQDYSHWLTHFDKIDADIEHYNLTVDNLNNLNEHQYVFVLSTLQGDRLVIEDDYIAKDTIAFDDLENEIGATDIKGVFYLLDKLPEASLFDEQGLLEQPSLIIALDDSKKCKKAIFELAKKSQFNKIENCLAINENLLDLSACEYSNDGPGINYCTSPLAPAVDANHLQNLVGRLADFEQLSRLLIKQMRSVGVLTVKGAGGIGKTTSVKKVAYELAKRGYFSAGVAFIDCEAVGKSDDVYDELKEQIGKIFYAHSYQDFDIKELRQDKKDRLIIVDNLETLLYCSDKAQCLELLEQISHCATVVITTREVSKIAGEQLYELRPFTLDEAYEYFVQQAQLANLNEEQTKLLREDIVETILNNNPLAIKLVTANMPAGKSLRQLKDDLHKDIFDKTFDEHISAFDAKADTNIDRKRSMYGSIAYSYQNLTGDEQAALLLLSTFPDGLPIEMLTRLQRWADEEKQQLDTQITDRTVKALQNKSMVETHGGMVFLQSMMAKFAEYQLDNHQDKTQLMQDAFTFQHILAEAIEALIRMNRSLGIALADNMITTLAKSIELSAKLKSDVQQTLTHIVRVCSILNAIGQVLPQQKYLNNAIGLLDGKAREFVKLCLQERAMSDNPSINFDDFKRAVMQPQIELQTELRVPLPANVNEFSDLGLLFELTDVIKEFTVKEQKEIYVGFFLSYGALSANTAKQLSESNTYEIQIKSQFNLKKLSELDEQIAQLHPNDFLKLELSYLRAKLKPLNTQQLAALPDFSYCRAIGIRALIYAFSETDSDKKESLFKRAIAHLKLSPYRFAEAHLYYAKFLQSQNRDEYLQVAEAGMLVAKKYHLNFLHFQFDMLLGKTDATDVSEYNPADYPQPFGIDLQPVVQEYIKEFGVKAGKGVKGKGVKRKAGPKTKKLANKKQDSNKHKKNEQ